MSLSDEYLAARAGFVEIDRKVTGLAQSIETVAKHLKEQRHKFVMTGAESALPESVRLDARHTFRSNAANWPTPEQIMALLADWHRARAIVRAAWEEIPAAWRAGLTEPPEGVLSDRPRYP